ncbi:MAG TPA: dipicolinate synthase subunit B [Bacillota bacterium]|jgi:dipicolinate synthase subunit B
MGLEEKRIGFAITGSHCTLERVMKPIEALTKAGAEVIPLVSAAVAQSDTRFGRGKDWVARLREITGHSPLASVVAAEPIGPKRLLDAIVVAPCTGNTLAKLANGITDGPVTMAVKATLRNGRPVILSLSSNDALGLNAKNLGIMLNAKNVYFVPFGQDNPQEKPTSIDSHLDLLIETVEAALRGTQLQPVLREWRRQA